MQMPWWAMLLSVLLLPLLQPLTEFGAEKLHTVLHGKPAIKQQQPAPQPPAPQQQQQPYIVYHEGRWWKMENNQWYFWVQN